MSLESILKILFDNAPLLGVFFLIAGAIKVFSYYKLFGIYIFEFIDIKEVLTLIINNLLAYFTILLTLSILLISKSYSGVYTYLLPISFTVLSLIYFFCRKRVFLYETLFQNIFFWFFFIVIRKIQPLLVEQKPNSDELKTGVLSIFLITLVLYSIANAISEYYKVRYKKYYSKTKILIEKIEFNSTLDKYYIGKTEHFVFIHNNLDKSNEIIPVSLVNKITFYKP